MEDRLIESSAGRLRSAIIASHVLLWFGVFMLPVGTFLQQRSPQYEAYYNEALAEAQRRTPDAEVGPAMFAGRVLAVPSTLCFSTFIGAVFVAGMMILRRLSHVDRTAGLVAAFVFCAGCSLVAILSFLTVWDDLKWGFVVLELGFSSFGLGILLGGVCGVVACLKPKIPVDAAPAG